MNGCKEFICVINAKSICLSRFAVDRKVFDLTGSGITVSTFVLVHVSKRFF